MKVWEMGTIGCIASDIVEKVKSRIAELEDKGEWERYDFRTQDRVLDLVQDELKARLPERGCIIEANVDEIRGLCFNAFAFPVTLAKLLEPNAGRKDATAADADAQANKIEEVLK